MRKPGRVIGTWQAAGLAAAFGALLACGAGKPSPSAEPTAAPTPAPTPAPAETPAASRLPLGQAIERAMALSADRHVAIAVVTSKGQVFPERLIVRKKLHYVVWIGDGDELKIEFKSAKLPVTCRDAVCWMDPAPDESGPEGFPYQGSIRSGADAPVQFDPRLEVVK